MTNNNHSNYENPYQKKVNEDDVTTMMMIFYVSINDHNHFITITNASFIHISNQTHKVDFLKKNQETRGIEKKNTNLLTSLDVFDSNKLVT